MLQKLFLSLNNFYMMYVERLDGLFGQNLQGVRGSKGLDFKSQRWRFLWTVLVFRVKEGLRIFNTQEALYFSDLLLLQMLPLFIGKRFVNKS